MAAPSSAGFDPRESDPEKRRAKLLQQRKSRTAERAQHERFVMSAADQVAERAENDLNDASLREPHLVPELLSLKEQMAQLPMPAWRSTAQLAEAQLLSVQHVALRQAIAEQNHYTVISSAKPIIKGAIIAADHSSGQVGVTSKPSRMRHRHLARLRARRRRKLSDSTAPIDKNSRISSEAGPGVRGVAISCGKSKPDKPARKLRGCVKAKHLRRKRKGKRSANKAKNVDAQNAGSDGFCCAQKVLDQEPLADCLSQAAHGSRADDIEVLLSQEHAAAEGLHSLSDAQQDHHASETVLTAALTAGEAVRRRPALAAGAASPPGAEPATRTEQRAAHNTQGTASSATSVKSSVSGHSRGSKASRGARSAPEVPATTPPKPMLRAASFRSNPTPTPHQQRNAAAQQRKQQLALQRSRSSRNVHGFDLSAHAQLAEGAAQADAGRTQACARGASRAKKSRRQARKAASEAAQAPAADTLFRVPPAAPQPDADADLESKCPPRKVSSLKRLSKANVAREIPPVLSSWQGHVPSQYPLLWGGTRKGLSRWPTVGAGEGLCGVMGQDVLPVSGANPPAQASILRYYAERKCDEEVAQSGSGKERVHQVQPGGMLMSVAATPAAPPRLHGGGTAQGETPHPLTGQAVLPPNVLTRLTPKQRLALGKQQLKQQAQAIAALIRTYTSDASAGKAAEAPPAQAVASTVRSARPVGANGLFAGEGSPARTKARSSTPSSRCGPASPLPAQHPFDASFGGVLPAKEQVLARDNHAAAVLMELQQRRKWLQRRQCL